MGGATREFRVWGRRQRRRVQCSAQSLGGGGIGTTIVAQSANNCLIFFGKGPFPLAYSDDDGRTWNAPGSTAGLANGFGVVWISGGRNLPAQFFALGTGSNTMLGSPDGISWTVRASGIFASFGNAVVMNNDVVVSWGGMVFFCSWFFVKNPVLVAVGQGVTSVAVSTDAIVWAGLASPMAIGGGVAFGAGKWVMVGSGSSTTIMATTNLANWTIVSGIFANAVSRFCDTVHVSERLVSRDTRSCLSTASSLLRALALILWRIHKTGLPGGAWD